MSPDFFSITDVSVSWCSSNGPNRSGGIENDRQRLDIDLDQISRVFGNIRIGGEDRCHRLADVAHDNVAPALAAGRLELHQAGQSKSDRRNVDDVGMGPDGMHARQGKGGFCIDRFQSPVRDRRAHDAHMPLAGK